MAEHAPNHVLSPRNLAIASGVALGAIAMRKAHNALKTIEPSPEEVANILPGDELVPDANFVVDRAFTLHGTPEEVWPWITSIGPERGHWPLPESVERFLPTQNRAPRGVTTYPDLVVGSTIGDWKVTANDFKGDTRPIAEVAILDPEKALIYKSEKVNGKGEAKPWSWAIIVENGEKAGDSRVQMRFRAAGIRHAEEFQIFAPLEGLITAGFAAGVNERLVEGRHK